MSSVVNLKESLVSRFAHSLSLRPHGRVGVRFGSALLTFALAGALALVGTGAAQADGNPLTAAPIDATTRQGQAVSIQLLGSGPVGDQLSYSLGFGFGPVATANGTVSMDTNTFPPSRAIYTPNPGFSGTDTFQYRVSDSQFDSALATVTVTVTPVAADNHPPIAMPFSLTCENPGQTQVLAAGTDVDGDVLSFALASQPSHGSVLLFADSLGTEMVYYPEDGYIGPDSFTYTANDGVLTSDPATVSVEVTPPRANSVPTSVPPKVTTAQDTPVTFTVPATDLDGDHIFFEYFQDAAHGTVSNSGDSQFTYTPDLGYSGTDTFHYDVTDHRSTSYSYTVNITVTPASVPAHTPSVRPFSVVTRGEPVAVTLLGADPDGDALSYTTASGPSHGVLSGSGADLTYTPDASYFGQDSFIYEASDGTHVSTPAVVKISVESVYDSIDPVLDVSVSADQDKPSSQVASPTFSTTGADRLILAFISVDGPASSSAAAAQRVSAVTGGNLSWTLVNRSNSTGGTAEVWQAHATSLVFGAHVTAKFAKGGFDGSITVAAFANTPGAVGASAATGGETGTATATVGPDDTGAPTRVWAVGHVRSRATTPVPMLDQELVHTFSDRHVGDTFWTERLSFANGGPVTIGLSTPTTGRWQLVAVTIPGLPSAAPIFTGLVR
jgi:hypothetical protein